MSPALFIYVLLLVLVGVGLWAAYRVLGTPSRLPATDYQVVLDDLVRSVEREAIRLRATVEKTAGGDALEEAAKRARRIFQTGYYQALRLRPTDGLDHGGGVREHIARACEAYDWASRMIGSESIRNPAIRDSAMRLLDAGDVEMRQAEGRLGPLNAPPGNNGQ